MLIMLINVHCPQLQYGVIAGVHNLLACYKIGMATYEGMRVVRDVEDLIDLDEEHFSIGLVI